MRNASRRFASAWRLGCAVALILSLTSASAQFGPRAGAGGPPRGPRLGGAMSKIFGDNTAFTAQMEMQSKDPKNKETIVMPGAIAFAGGKSRFEMDLAKMQHSSMPKDAASAMKSMGMDVTVMISRPDKQVAYMVYPGLKAYLETPLQEGESGTPDDYKIESTELGKETVDGHPCVKSKSVVTDAKGQKQEAIVWNATDLKNFPIKIEQNQDGAAITLRFKDIKLTAPDASVFDPPSGFKRHENMMGMMQEMMMKRGAPGQ